MKAAQVSQNYQQPVQISIPEKDHYYTKTRFLKNSVPAISCLLLSVCFFLTAQAQTFTISVSNSTIGKNQYAEVSYEIANAASIENFQVPPFKDWLIVSGPSNSSYQSNINGQVSQKTTISFYLQPKRTGRLTVEGAKVILNGKSVTSASKTVVVLDKNIADPPSSGNSGANPADPFGNLLNDPFFAQPPAVQAAPREDEFADGIVLRPGESTPEKIRNNLFLKVIPSKNVAYEGEPIMATYKVYTRLDMDANVTRRPSFSGFSAYDMEQPNQPYVVETVNGRKYKSWVIRKVQLYPLQSGNLTLEPVEVDCDIRFIKGERVDAGTFDPYTQDGFTKVQYTLKSPAISINVIPLPPANRPANFGGAVGNFTIKAAVNENAPGKDDAVHLTVGIGGSGNFSMVHAPAVPWTTKTEAYEPKEAENLDKSVMPIHGDKSFDYVFLPHQAGNFTIPAISFSYFDVAAKTYKTVFTQPITLQVAKESKHRNLITGEQEQNWPGQFSKIAPYVLPVLAVGLLLFLIWSTTDRKKQRRQLSKQKQAERVAWDSLVREAEAKRTIATSTSGSQEEPGISSADAIQPAEQHHAYLPAELIQQPVIKNIASPEEIPATKQFTLPALQADTLIWNDDHKLFYKALKSDIMQVLSTVSATSTANKTGLMQILKEKGADPEVLQQINSLADECDAALYSPISDATNRQKTLEEAKFLLAKLQTS